MSNIKSKRKVVVLPLVLERKLPALPYLALGMLTAYARSYKDGMLESVYNINRVMVAGHTGAPLKTVYGKVTESPKSRMFVFFLCVESRAQYKSS